MEEGLNSSDSESGSLKIAIDNESTPEKKKVNQFSNRDLDKTIEETIEKCENFTPEIAKKMLLKLIKNEHILALSLLKAEEQEMNQSQTVLESDDDDKKSESEAPATPKLTRLKAKQLNQTLPIPGSLKTTEPCEEVVALINDEFDDDEDDEYQPCESDEDGNNQTLSDIESQPSTPGSALFQSEQDIDSPVKDNDFRGPRVRTLSAEEQENISRRTRSKLCLTTTPIETIESAFIPPDITTDMYDFDQDHEVDNDWMGFLSEFLMPLNNVDEDDEKSDPEYVVAESVPVDREELRPVRVSKKELNQLISELLEDTSSLNFDHEPSTSYKRNSGETPLSKNKRQRTSSPQRSKTQSPKISSRMYTPQELNTPPIRHDQNVAVTPEPTTPSYPKIQPLFDSNSQAYFQSQLMTPQRTGFATPPIMQSPVIFPSPPVLSFPTELAMTPEAVSPIAPAVSRLPQITGVYGSAVPSLHQQATSPQVLVINSQNQLEVQSSSNLMNQVFCSNGVMQLPQFQSIVVQVPTIDLLQNRLNFSSIIAPTFDSKPDIANTQPNQENLTDDRKTKLHYTQEKLNEFAYLEDEAPSIEKTFDVQLVGFTPEQRKLYEQQMKIHAQLLAQHFVQVYANPKWWEKAEPIKENLIELQSVVKEEFSPHTATHIGECLKLCNKWEQDLQSNDERNKKYAEHLYEEHDLDVMAFEDKSKKFKGRFHPRLMELLLSSKAIIYPSLLPRMPFRAVTYTKVDPPNSELRLLALGLDRFYREQRQKLNSLNPYRLREPKLGSVTRDLKREYGSFRTENGMMKIVENYKNHARMNPIKYFFVHKTAPAIKFDIEEVDLEFIVPPKNLRRGLLPKSWDSYMFSQERLRIHPYELAVKETQSENQELLDEVSNEKAPLPENSLPEPITEISINNQYKIEICYDDIPKINICVVPSSPEKVPEVKISCISLSSPIRVREKSTEEKQKNLISILKKVTDNLEKSPKQKKSVNFILPPRQINRSSPRFTERLKATKEIANSFLLSQKFFIVVESYFTSYIKNLRQFLKTPLLIRFFNWTKTIDIYLQFVQQAEKHKMLSKKQKNESGTSDFVPKTKKNPSSSEEYSKRLHRKLTENRNLIMESERNKCTIEKDCSYAYNYLERVKKTLTENGDDELYKELMSMLTSFNPDFESVPELYHKIEMLLLPNYADLVDLFLTFLLPEHAAEVGKFFEHFCLNNMTSLLKKLNLYFKQPSHMRKVYSVLNDLSNEEDLTMDRLKAKVLPLLKGNQLLIDWFMELFGTPMPSVQSEYENVYIKKSLSDSENSVDENYEEIYSKDLIECKNIEELNTCGVKYKNGKLTYHGTLLPAKISFLAHDSPSPSSTKTEDNSLCQHEIRKHVKFNDPKKAEEVVEDTKKAKVKKFRLCDAPTLHAHAVRLNSIHAQNGEKLSDLSHLLIPTHPLSGGNDERHSPKKTRNTKKSGNSPKKTLNKSPTSANLNSDLAVNSPSKALQTAKKLRNLIDDEVEDPRQTKKRRKVTDSQASTSRAAKKLKSCSKKSNDLPKMAEGNSEQNGKRPSTSKDADNHVFFDWTREEDKIILEEINVGYENDEVLLDMLEPKLTNRLRDEIDARRKFLMDVVNRSKSGK